MSHTILIGGGALEGGGWVICNEVLLFAPRVLFPPDMLQYSETSFALKAIKTQGWI
jgi:hypothetical protein